MTENHPKTGANDAYWDIKEISNVLRRVTLEAEETQRTDPHVSLNLPLPPSLSPPYVSTTETSILLHIENQSLH